MRMWMKKTISANSFLNMQHVQVSIEPFQNYWHQCNVSTRR